MAHVEKFQRKSLGHMLKHFERAKEDNGEYVNFGNENIDLTRTGTNYNVAAGQSLSQWDFIHKRLSQVKVQDRDDVNIMCSWIVTLPKGEDKVEKQFFEEVFKFLSNRYGQENVISAYVHRDERQPHMHFAFIPVVPDTAKNRKRFKVSAKELLNKKDLQHFHEDLENHLFLAFHRDMGVRNDATKFGNKSVRDLKRETALAEQKKIEQEIQASQDELSKLIKKIERTKLPEHIDVLKDKKNEVVISKEDFQKIKDILKRQRFFEEKTRDAELRMRIAERERDQARNHDYQAEIQTQREENYRLREINDGLRKENKRYYLDSATLRKMLENNIDLRKEYKVAKTAVQAETGEIEME